MTDIDFIHTCKPQAAHTWRRYIVGGIGFFATGILGIGIHNLMNPLEPSMAQLQQLNLYRS